VFEGAYHTVFLLLGSNQGNAIENLQQAKTHLKTRVGAQIQASACYKTAAWGKIDQPDFINQVVVLETRLKPEELLTRTLNIETEMGRLRVEKWGSRIIDIDILFFDSVVISTPTLSIPHPAISQRKFTLIPLVEIAPDFLHPVLKKSLQTLLSECKDSLAVQKME
jgi:2-amino-4-hydroxy-6-hydroxymethyldihydropteridine diphosphokinase